MKKKTVLFLILFQFVLLPAHSIQSLLSTLDTTIEQSNLYEERKTKYITDLKQRLSQNTHSSSEEFQLRQTLIQEYETYQADSAICYINQNIELAVKYRNENWKNESMLKKARILAVTGLYYEAVELLQTINKEELSKELLIRYYFSFEKVYSYRHEYVQNSEYSRAYLAIAQSYRDSVLLIAPEKSYTYYLTKTPLLVEEGKLEEAERLMIEYAEGLNPETREFAIANSLLAYIYKQSKDKYEQQKMRLALSAMADIKAVVKENNSLRALAELLYEEGDIEHAQKYMKKSVDDASFYNARLRNLQTSKRLSAINSGYQSIKEAEREKLQTYIYAIGVLLLLFSLVVFYVVYQIRTVTKVRHELLCANLKLKRLNKDLLTLSEEQRVTNSKLSEVNRIKEEYLGHFLQLGYVNLEKLDTYRRMLNKLAAAGKIEDLYRKIKSTEFLEEQLKDFHAEFDHSFLHIFPHFVENFNQLLPEEERVMPKKMDTLTTELRIFALIRLGITDSGKIADFLNCAISTIYSYRSKFKTRSLYKDDFEEQLMKIESFKN
ncbi:MAG: DUF6377 domain-containing protein [Phocaeicola sp.]